MATLLKNVKFGGAIIPKGTVIDKNHVGYKYLLQHTDEHDETIPAPKWKGDDVKQVSPEHAAAAAAKDTNSVSSDPATATVDPYADLTKAQIIEKLTQLGVEIPKDVKTKEPLLELLKAKEAETPAETAPATDPATTGDAGSADGTDAFGNKIE